MTDSTLTPERKRFTIRELFGCPTQRQVAEALNVDASLVNRWVQGRVIPNGYNLQRLARYFNVSADDIDLEVEDGKSEETGKRAGC